AHESASRELLRESEERVEYAQRQAVKGGYVGTPPGTGPDTDVADAVTVQVEGGNADAPDEIRAEREECFEKRAIGAVEDRDLGAAAGARARDNIGAAVAVDIRGGDRDATGEGRGIREKVEEQPEGLAAKHAHVGAAAGAGADYNVGGAVAISVAGG